MSKDITIGIDEAGRGPLAGPVSVGLFATDSKTARWILKNIFENKLRDSKKLSEKKREEIYKKLLILKKQNLVYFSVSHTSNKIIDKYGISYAINLGINKCLKEFENFNIGYLLKIENLPAGEVGCKLKILLDGSLKAPESYLSQKTIIGGDAKNIFIACASIVAKVSRDRLMCRLALKYPEYSLEIHKGYGTSLHTKAIKKFGLLNIHRQSFCNVIYRNKNTKS